MSEDLALIGNWNYPTAVRFGAGRLAELPAACRELGMRNPLLVTDEGLAELPVVERAQKHCQAAGLQCGLYADVQGNPIERNVTDGVRHFHEGSHDGVIAFGGGSGLDAGKAIGLMVGQERPIWDFEDREDWWTRVNTDGMAPVVAVPTTSGTGSEVGRASVITDQRDHTKKIIFHPRMLPAIVIADPELTLDLPAKVTAAVGMDALSHNLEAYCSLLFHPLAHGIALEGIALVHQWLSVAYEDNANLTARAHMMAASTMGATSFQKGLGAMHSLSHPCGAVLNTHHGLTNAVVMPYVLVFNRPAIEHKMTALARYLDLAEASFEAVLAWVLELREAIGIPHTLSELGVTLDRVEALAVMALADPSTATNPVPLTTEDFKTLYRKAIQGDLD
jgi:alcohol dehydrogenase class IV